MEKSSQSVELLYFSACMPRHPERHGPGLVQICCPDSPAASAWTCRRKPLPGAELELAEGWSRASDLPVAVPPPPDFLNAEP